MNYEYKVVEIDPVFNLESELNKFGKYGWLLCAMRTKTYVLVRPLA